MSTDGRESGTDTAEYTEYAERENAGWGFFGIFWVFVMLLLLYVLSCGPVAKAYDHTTPPRSVRAFYEPLGWLVRHSIFADHVLRWYLVKVWHIK